MIAIAIVAYVVAVVAANLSIAYFGPWVSPINAFLLIGFDLALRDWLHVRLRPAFVGVLILAAAGLSYLLNPTTGQIAFASCVAFTAAALADWAVFSYMRGRSWTARANGSNVVGAVVDSILFPTIAFGALLPQIVLAQFAAKVIGGALWSWALGRGGRK